MADKKVVFVAFATEDERQRDFLKGQSPVDSLSNCTSDRLFDDFIRGAVAEAFARPIIECDNDRCKMIVIELREIGSLGEVAP